jgi:CRP/FNR family cyclic AMP-dependent transcriptional regulator
MSNLVPMALSASAFLTKTGPGRRITYFKPEELVFTQGAIAKSLYYLHKGRLRLTVVSHNGREAGLALLFAGDFVGEESLGKAGSRRRATATAITACTALQINREEMIRALKGDPALSDIFLKFLLKRTMRFQADLIDQLFNSSEKRLARILLLMARYGIEGTPEPLIPSITQETLATMVGTTRSRVSFFMNRFRNLGFIEYNGRIRVHKELLNVILHDDILDQNREWAPLEKTPQNDPMPQ